MCKMRIESIALDLLDVANPVLVLSSFDVLRVVMRNGAKKMGIGRTEIDLEPLAAGAV